MDEAEFHARRVPRILNGVMGTALVVGAVLGARDGLDPWWRGVGLAVLGVVGVQALASAVRGTRSWVSRFPPLP